MGVRLMVVCAVYVCGGLYYMGEDGTCGGLYYMG